MRRKRAKGSKRVVLRRQRDVLCDVMLSAGQCEAWLTLDELAKLTHYPPASISAQLRHLRKPQYGGFVLEKRQRAVDRVTRSEELGAVWEYQLQRGLRVRVRKGRTKIATSRLALQLASC